MCTAVIGGSIHRAATRISTASDQRSAAPMKNHRTKDRRKPFRGGVSGSMSGFSVTLQNSRLGWIDIEPGPGFQGISAICPRPWTASLGYHSHQAGTFDL